MTLTKDEKELLSIIRESADPQNVAEYAFNLFMDYIGKKMKAGTANV